MQGVCIKEGSASRVVYLGGSTYRGICIKGGSTDPANIIINQLIAGSLEAAYSLNWGAREIWGKGGGETLALL